MTHLWVRGEQRDNEMRVGLTPEGAAELIAQGFRLTLEDSPTRCIATSDYAKAGAEIAAFASWPDAPRDAIIFGLKELPEDDTPLPHRHILFGHAYKGQPAGQRLLRRFKAGGGTLYDLEYLLDDTDRRVAAFGYWAGYAGAAMSLKCWIAQQLGTQCGPVSTYETAAALRDTLAADLTGHSLTPPSALVIGALGRVGSGAADFCDAMGLPVTRWDIAETAHGGPFPEILAHDLFLNCILARPGTPVFVPQSAKTAQRRLSVIGDIACDPDSAFSPIKVYAHTTSWQAPALRVHDAPVLDVTAIDNLPSLLPLESSQDFAEQLLPSLRSVDELTKGPFAKAHHFFVDALAQLD